jgi:AraC-like DNA-binding protein
MTMSVISFLIFLGGANAVMIGTGYAAGRHRSTGRCILILFLLVVAVWQTYHGLMISGLLVRYPHFGLVHVPFLYATGPLLYFFSKFLTRDEYSLKPCDALHFIPSLVIAALLAPFYMKSAEEKRRFLVDQIGIRAHDAFTTAYSIMILLIILAIIVYIVKFWKHSMIVFRSRHLKLNQITYFSMIIVAINFLVVIIYIAGFILYHAFSLDHAVYEKTIIFISLITTLMVYLVFLMGMRYSDYFSLVMQDARKMRYSKSRIDNLMVDEIIARLESLMTGEKVFCDEDLSLQRLSDEIGIAPYQLSQILNERLNKNFNTYINEYRVMEAAAMIVGEPSRSITSIAFAVGFNNKSSFYSWFFKVNGVSPVRYRRKMLGGQ